MLSHRWRKSNTEPEQKLSPDHVRPGPVSDPVEMPVWTARLQRKPALTVSKPGDRHEQEADRVAEHVLRAPGRAPQQQGMEPAPASRRQGTRRQGARRAFNAPGQPLETGTRAFMESRFGYDFSHVRVHTGDGAGAAARSVQARAFTLGRDIVFGSGEYAPNRAEGRRLLAHELTHVIQQDQAAGDGARQAMSAIQRNEDQDQAQNARLTAPLTESEWRSIEMWQSYGEVGIEPLTADPAHNALVVASALFCSRLLGSWEGEDPLLCVLPEVTQADPRVRQLVRHVTARGPIINWASVGADQRILHVMELLVNQYNYPVNGAAGLVGNLYSESGVMPNRIEGSASATPMRSANFAGTMTDFTAEQVMNRNLAAQQGPRRPGIGLAQWTTANRRAGLFQHTFQGRQMGASILFSMDAQVDYLVSELQGNYAHVNNVITGAGVSVNDAADEVVYRFEVPGAVLDANGQLLPRNDPAVQAVFAVRRNNAHRALQVYQQAHP